MQHWVSTLRASMYILVYYMDYLVMHEVLQSAWPPASVESAKLALLLSGQEHVIATALKY